MATYITQLFLYLQRLASDFLANYIFIAAGKVGSSTDLIDQRVEFVHDMDKRGALMKLLNSRSMNRRTAKVHYIFTLLNSFSIFGLDSIHSMTFVISSLCKFRHSCVTGLLDSRICRDKERSGRT